MRPRLETVFSISTVSFVLVPFCMPLAIENTEDNEAYRDGEGGDMGTPHLSRQQLRSTMSLVTDLQAASRPSPIGLPGSILQQATVFT